MKRVTVPSRRRPSRWAPLALALGLLPVASGCTGKLQVTRLNSEQKKPNNVWVFFTVEDDEEPVGGLTADDFAIYEDDQLVSTFESKQTIQNPDVAAVMYTLLLLDMSGSITESGQSDLVVDAAEGFVERVGQSQKVAVYAFDGGKDIRSVVRFTEAKGSVEGGLEGLRTYKARDPSTNLHGAIVQGLDELHEALEKDDRPLKFGTMVVFTDGTDRAARVSAEEMKEALEDEKHADYEIFAIGVGADVEEGEGSLKTIGRDGTEMAANDSDVKLAFEKVAQRIDNHSKRFYLLSYCTPARNGEHTVRIEAQADRNNKGKARKKGETTWTFDAAGFGPPPDCDPNRQPTFKLDAVTPKDGEDSGGGGSKGSSGKGSGKASASKGDGKAEGKAKGGFTFGKPSGPGGGGE
ncbi:VWA domain-containing protein [Paraliomyxa miuraensis]|uniref:VWA domain-containing protein n=1 Tax=Paraliomyxa miuraensis TaxID=376150 RepID=UPI00224E356E|nr:VWA domain-containing protein [Paraliomyxa miuraensis]MCX4240606.1 VWA domain-containing protein [Paraliomyxa miuraensis]